LYSGSVLGLTVGNVTVLQFSTSVLMKPIIAEFGWNRGMVSAAVMLGMIFAAIATAVAGRLIDRHGIRMVTTCRDPLFALYHRRHVARASRSRGVFSRCSR